MTGFLYTKLMFKEQNQSLKYLGKQPLLGVQKNACLRLAGKIL